MYRPIAPQYDVVIVGARVAGAATGMLLARAGLDVLVVDKASPTADTLSTHALMRGAVSQLDRWGLIDAVIAAGTPVIRRTTFSYAGRRVPVDIKPEGGASGLYAPRRTVLDPIIVDAAREAGAVVHHHTRLVEVMTDTTGRATGVVLANDIGSRTVRAGLVIGADGLHSKLARNLDVPVTRQGAACTAAVIKYVQGANLAADEYLWLTQTDRMGGAIPTNDDTHCVFVSLPPATFAGGRRDLDQAFESGLAALDPAVADAVATATPVGGLRSFPGHPGQFRQASGPGWALVGDAGYFKDPGSAHGISDAELLASAIVDGDIARYGQYRDELSDDLFKALENVIDFSWTLDELPDRHVRMAKAMSREQRAVQDLRVCETAHPAAA